MTPIRWMMLGLVGMIGWLLYFDHREKQNYPVWLADRIGLSLIGQSYREYQAKHGKPPTRIDDLKEGRTERGVYDQLKQEGRYEIIWGAPFKLDDDQPCDEVLGRSSITTYKGINVLMRNGATRTMTADELAKPPKARKESKTSQ